MELNLFKDKLFDMLNESDSMNIADIEADDAAGAFQVKTTDGDLFIIECRQGSPAERVMKQS